MNPLQIALKKEQARSRRAVKKLLNDKRPKGLFPLVVPHAACLLRLCGVDLSLPARQTFPLYFSRKNRRWFLRNSRGNYHPTPARIAKTLLWVLMGEDSAAADLWFCYLKGRGRGVDCVLKIQGCEPGLHIVDGQRVLIVPPLDRIEIEEV